MTKGKVPLFRACAKAIKHFISGKRLSDQQISDIKEARERLRLFIVDLASNEEISVPHVMRAMNYVNPETLYGSDSLIRDLADICLTLKRVAEGKGRSQDEKAAHADLFCMGMHYEPRAIPPVVNK